MKKALLLLTTFIYSFATHAQTPEFTITQPACGEAFGNIQITSPLNNLGPIADDLYISEVVDANLGGLSYIELFNATGAAVNMANYKLRVFSNGFSNPSCDLTLSGSIANYGVFVVSVGSSTNLGGVVPNLTFSSCTGFNTNDAVMLTTLNNDPIDLWGALDGTVFTPLGQAGYTYRRHTNVSAPNTTWNVADWDALDPEDYTNVGSYSTAVNYQYSLDNGPFQSSPVFTQIALGTHTLTAQNLNTGNQYEASFVIQPHTMNTPVTDFYYTLPVCQNFGIAVPEHPSNFTYGGIYTAPSYVAINPNSGIINLSLTPPGMHLITYTIAPDLTLCVQGASSSYFINVLPMNAPPQGEANQTFTQPNPTLADFVVSPTQISWFASYNDALSNNNALAANTALVDGVTYYAVNNSLFCPSLPTGFTAHMNLSAEAFSNFSLEVVPNPASSQITVRTHNNLSIDRLIIRDISGKTVCSQTAMPNNQINVESLAGGLYLIEAFVGTEKFQAKLFKQ